VFIRASRTHSPLAIPAIALLAAGLWVPAFLFDYTPRPQVHMPFYAFLVPFGEQSPLASRAVAFLLLLLQGAGLNYFIQAHQVLTKRSYLPALFFVVLGSCTPGLLRLHPGLVANTFLLPALYLMYDTYRMDTAYSKVFYAGLLVSLASLFYFPAIAFAPAMLVCLVIFRPFIWREWIILLLGLALPYIYTESWLYLTDRPFILWDQFIISPIRNRDFFLALPVTAYLLTGVISLLLLTAAFRFVAGAGAATLKTRKGVSVMLWLLLFAVAATLPAQDFGVSGFFFVVAPFSVFISNYFLLARRIWLAEIIFALLLAGIAVAYWPLINK
jgi:hypothetical protein